MSMRPTTVFAVSAGFMLAALFTCPSALTADLNGAWASDLSVCNKVFTKVSGKMVFAPDSELYGGGLVVEGKRASGTFQKCTIRSMEDDGATVHVIAACSTGVMVSDLKLTVKITGDNQITLSPVGPVDTQTTYVRCPLQ